jgi:ATP-dependent Zn protease
MASQMVGSFGMAGSLLSLDAAQGPMGEDLVSKVLADDASREAAEKILVEAKADAERLLVGHQAIHAALRDALLERGELVGEEILDVIRAAILRDELKSIDLREQRVD